MTAAPILETPPLLNVMGAVATAHVVEAAADLGLLDHLTSGPTDMSNSLRHAQQTHQ
jgi:hypothetical protein